MKSFIRPTTFAAVSVFAALASIGSAEAADVTANASATVIAPIAIAEDTAMDFGTIAPTTSVGTVVLGTDSSRTPSGGAELVTGGSEAAGAFTVTGEGSQAYTVTLPAASSTLTSGVDTTSVDTFTISGSTSRSVGVGGSDSFSVGATVAVAASQAAGTYAGTYVVSVAYD